MSHRKKPRRRKRGPKPPKAKAIRPVTSSIGAIAPPDAASQTDPRQHQKLTRVGKSAWLIFGAIAGLASILSVGPLAPRFTVQPGEPLDRRNVLTTPFVVTYDVLWPTSLVWARCALKRLTLKVGDTISFPDSAFVFNAPSMSLGDSHSISCAGIDPENLSLSSGFPPPSGETEVAIVITYHLRFWPWQSQTSFRFKSVTYADSTMRFLRSLPQGSGQIRFQ